MEIHVWLNTCVTCGLYNKHITIINDDSRVVSKWHSKLWHHFLMTLEVSFMLLKSSITFLENIYSTSVTHDDHHIFKVLSTEMCATWVLLLQGFQNRVCNFCCLKMDQIMRKNLIDFEVGEGYIVPCVGGIDIEIWKIDCLRFVMCLLLLPGFQGFFFFSFFWCGY